jgi:hypothetical protein
MITDEYHNFTYGDWLEYIFVYKDYGMYKPVLNISSMYSRIRKGITHDPWTRCVEVPTKFQKDELLLALKLTI